MLISKIASPSGGKSPPNFCWMYIRAPYVYAEFQKFQLYTKAKGRGGMGMISRTVENLLLVSAASFAFSE